MQQFDLSFWLQDKSRKIVTRSGVEAEIIHDKYPLVAIINGVAYNFDNDGKFQSNRAKHPYDLFFADEENELTKFEKALSDIIGFWQQGNYVSKDIKTDAKTLLYLARKEILKDLPKWKKAKKDEELDCHVAIQQDDRVVLSDFVQKGEYYITLDVLKTLSKEE